METVKPKIFISSTIYDFRDLRSALKYNLESLGFEVLLSDYNDFIKDLNLNSYEACLDTIRECDYYILLVGSRVGGFFDLKNKISITQQEYRTAYQSSKNGSPKILLFVRQEIWDIRKDRDSLEKYLIENYVKQRELQEEDIINIVNHNSIFVNDAKFIFQFLNEIERNEEMLMAQKGKAEYPRSNWVSTFSSYKNIVDTLNVEFKFSKSLKKIAVSENLKIELLSNLRVMTSKHKGEISFCNNWLTSRHKYKGDLNSYSTFTSSDLSMLSVYCILGTSIGNNLNSQFIDSALTSGEFLTYNIEKDRYEPSLIQLRLIDLKNNIERLKKLEKDFDNYRFELHTRYKNYPMTDAPVKVLNSELIHIMAISDCQTNIYLLLIALYKAIDGNDSLLSKIKLYPTSPLTEVASRMKEERFTNEELFEFIDNLRV